MPPGHPTSDSDLRQLYKSHTRYPGVCALCWIPQDQCRLHRFYPDLHMAHIISRARGGQIGQCVGNVLFLCSSCHGANHECGYTYDQVKWPEVSEALLIRVKDDMCEFDPAILASIGGKTAEWYDSQRHEAIPELISAERKKWHIQYLS